MILPVTELPLTFTLIVALVSIFLVTDMKIRAMRRPLPGPKIAKFTERWMRWRELTGKSVPEIHRLHRKYGPIVQIAPKGISFCHVDALRAIYRGPRGLDASPDISIFRQYGSENLVSTVNADLHRSRRQCVAGLYSGPTVASPAFQDTLKTYINRFMDVVEQNATSSSSRTVNVFPWIKWLTCDVMIELVFGSKKAVNLLGDPEARRRFKELIKTSFADEGLGRPLATAVLLFPRTTTKVLNMLQPEPEINAFGMERVKEASTSTDAQSPLHSRVTHLKHLLAIYEKDGPNSTIPNTTYIASDSVDHFFAGSSTTTDLMTAAIWRLSFPENKIYQERLRKELRDAVVSSADAMSDISTLQQLPFLTNVLRETLRVDPPIPFNITRVVKEGQDVEVMGIKIEPGTQISVPIYSLHRDPEAFPHPETWDPERWLLPVSSPIYKQMTRSLIPFGTGARMCTGMNVAWAETRLLLAKIYSTYETRLGQAWFDKNGTLRPASERQGLYPRTVELPIEFRKLLE